MAPKSITRFRTGSTEPTRGFEPRTPSLPWKCSTTELRRRMVGEHPDRGPGTCDEHDDAPDHEQQDQSDDLQHSQCNVHRGRTEIRTLEAVTPTRFPGERLGPLGYPSEDRGPVQPCLRVWAG